MDIIDFHTHIYPKKISERAVSSIGEFYNLKMTGSGTSETLLMEKRRITKFLVHSVAVDEKHVEPINNFIISECAEHSELLGFATIHKNYKDKVGESERIFSEGLKGIKIHPDTQKFNMDDREMFELYDYLQEVEKPILIHCGDYRYDYSHPKRVCAILKNFPKLKVIAAHFGGWSVYDLALEYLKNENCYVDTSSSFAMIGLARAKELINIYGAERVLFGSDFPMWNPETELDNFLNLKLSDKQNELILCDNAKRLLNLDEVIK